MAEYSIRSLVDSDREWARQRIQHYWGAQIVVMHGTVYHPADLPGFLALYHGDSVALATFHLEGSTCELVSLDCDVQGIGIGTALVATVLQAAKKGGCRRVSLVTTNDNLHALGFYQKRGFHLVAVHPEAVTEARKQKPSIPMIGENGIPIRDEIVLEITIG
ncbi:MAG: GNAT family N-acetyltransferase [Anaerolineaceae bacterium]|jgi:GNAT superfamily N-acetyltransferase